MSYDGKTAPSSSRRRASHPSPPPYERAHPPGIDALHAPTVLHASAIPSSALRPPTAGRCPPYGCDPGGRPTRAHGRPVPSRRAPCIGLRSRRVPHARPRSRPPPTLGHGSRSTFSAAAAIRARPAHSYQSPPHGRDPGGCRTCGRGLGQCPPYGCIPARALHTAGRLGQRLRTTAIRARPAVPRRALRAAAVPASALARPRVPVGALRYGRGSAQCPRCGRGAGVRPRSAMGPGRRSPLQPQSGRAPRTAPVPGRAPGAAALPASALARPLVPVGALRYSRISVGAPITAAAPGRPPAQS